jgi:hypothetical protein
MQDRARQARRESLVTKMPDKVPSGKFDYSRVKMAGGSTGWLIFLAFIVVSISALHNKTVSAP